MKRIPYLILLLLSFSCGDGFYNSGSADLSSPGQITGQGGSLARFAVTGSTLYTINNFEIKVFDIADCADVSLKNRVDVGFGIETLFPINDYLFIGAQDAMYIYDIANPETPQFLSWYGHFTSCDPVVVQGNYAYVTLRISECRPSQDRDVLEIIDVSDVLNPVSVSTYNLDEPYGLGISGDLLFICEGNNGLKVLDVSDPNSIQLVKQFTGINAYDVIPTQNILILTGEDGIRQYDFSDPNNITLISEIYAAG